jgi:hypothetical protein
MVLGLKLVQEVTMNFSTPYPPPQPSSLPYMWSVPMAPSKEQEDKIWNAAINAAMLLLYEEGQHSEIVMPLKTLLRGSSDETPT